MGLRGIAVVLMMMVTLTVGAQEEEDSFWSGDVEVGAVFTSGNTEQESIKFKLGAAREKGNFVNTFHADTFKASEDGNDTADKLYTFYRLDRKIDDHQAVFGRLAYEQDE